MTNAQKAQEIAKVHEVHYGRFHGETSNDECFLSALEMAEWKDECLQTVINRIKDFYLLDGSAIFICDLIEQRYKDKFK